MEIFKIIILSLSGVLMIYGGSSRLFKPLASFCLKSYLDNPNFKLEGKIDVFNEMRAAGTSISLGGIVILLGIILPQLTMTSFIVAIVIFLGHALGRLVSLKLDGKPGQQMSMGLTFDLGLGILNTICLLSILM